MNKIFEKYKSLFSENFNSNFEVEGVMGGSIVKFTNPNNGIHYRLRTVNGIRCRECPVIIEFYNGIYSVYLNDVELEIIPDSIEIDSINET